MHLADKISNSELEVMKLLWQADSPVSSTEIRSMLQDEKGWEKSTILTLIRRLHDKGVINAEKRDVFYYSPNISEAEFAEFQMQEMANKLYKGNVKSLVAALCHGGKLSEADIDDLKAYFKVEGQDE
ncbi:MULTISPECIES: BlaI/MecI/CopY family transcriptional regulator [unclassified Paenibacillus]|uniref:BlaI/MecI/CopY family transcriptional regulator n=1 Tax=unclassified Paenibacillus TaxID=185978 RepID=UPI001C0F6FE2|nr:MULTISPECIES: BlaI/MecI/CopY family transcriptional regulator [unclassified Paenibacillus]MBU5443650.1 BlaI/MecI/CopY family transcriptional regulator [Paenibacillus sp. MSJ-34]CAH0117687.1 Penicillinase repressor [Paenibacillus sp. CECT 9249]